MRSRDGSNKSLHFGDSFSSEEASVLTSTLPPQTPCVRPVEALYAQMGKPRHREALLSSPSCPLKKEKKKKKKRITSTSIRPQLSEEGAQHRCPPREPSPRPWPASGLVTTPGAPSEPRSSSTSTGRVPEPLHPGGGLWPPVSSAQDLLYFREEDLCIICGYIS